MYRKNVNAILHLIVINAALLLETTCKNKKYIKKSNMVCLLVGSDARVNNIANQTKSSNKIFFNYTGIQFWNFIIK